MFFARGTFSQIASIDAARRNEIFDIGEIVSVGRDRPRPHRSRDRGRRAHRLRAITLRAFDMKQLFVPTRVLAPSHVVNWSRRPRKEIRATVTLAHDTHPEAAARLLHGVKRRVCVDPGLDHAQYSKVEFTSLQAGCDEKRERARRAGRARARARARSENAEAFSRRARSLSRRPAPSPGPCFALARALLDE